MLAAETNLMFVAVPVLVILGLAVAALLLMKKRTAAGTPPAGSPSAGASAAAVSAPAPAVSAPAQAAPAAPPAPLAPVAAPQKPATLMVEALAPSETGMAPMLAEPGLEPAMDELKIGTDELPRVGTGQVPMLGEPAPVAPARGRYRTPAAQQLADAIESMTCPKCGAPTFVGKETPEEVGADGTGMFKLEARCGACGHRANLIDMRVG